jgi:hypothetical protein
MRRARLGGGASARMCAAAPVVAALNTKWYGDGTEIPAGEGKRYLASVLDVASQRILGFALGEHHDTQLAYGVLAMAVTVRGGQVPAWSSTPDQGSEYTACMLRAILRYPVSAGAQQCPGPSYAGGCPTAPNRPGLYQDTACAPAVTWRLACLLVDGRYVFCGQGRVRDASSSAVDRFAQDPGLAGNSTITAD